MRFVLLMISILLLANCSKPKTVLICGDHVCVNRAEAEQYFQENLSIEVRLVNKKVKNTTDLVELNLKENQNGDNKISILSKKSTKKDIKILSNEEINKIKKNIKVIKKEKNVSKKKIEYKKKIINNEKKFNKEENKILKNNVNKRNNDVVDVCLLLEKCNIDEISKFLLEKSKKKGFPDITIRQ